MQRIADIVNRKSHVTVSKMRSSGTSSGLLGVKLKVTQFQWPIAAKPLQICISLTLNINKKSYIRVGRFLTCTVITTVIADIAEILFYHPFYGRNGIA
jgi:hypothetical protein